MALNYKEYRQKLLQAGLGEQFPQALRAAMNRDTASATFGGSEYASKNKDAVAKMATASNSGTDEVLKMLTSTAMLRGEKGDVANYDAEGTRQAAVDQAAYLKYLSKLGLYDQAKYALNSDTINLVQTDYLKNMLKAQEMELRLANAKQAAWDTRMQTITPTLAELEKMQGSYAYGLSYDELLDEYEGSEESISPIVQGWLDVYNAYNPGSGAPQTWEELRAIEDEDEYQQWLADTSAFWRDSDEWNSGNWSMNLAQTKPDYGQSKTQANIDAINSELERRQTLEALENKAASIRAYAEQMGYADPGVYETDFEFQDVGKVGMFDFAGMKYLRELERTYANNPVFYANNIPSEEIASQLASDEFANLEGLNMLTADELATLNALDSLDRTNHTYALQYIEAKKAELMQRRADVQNATVETYAADPLYGSLMTGYSILMSPVTAAMTIGTTAADMLGADFDSNSWEYDLQRINNTTRSTAGEALGEAWNWNVLGQPIGTIAYGVLTSIGDMLVAQGLGSGIASAAGGSSQAAAKAMQAIMSSEAAAGTIYEDLEKGYTSEQAFLHGMANGAIEAWTESGFIDNLFSEGGNQLVKTLKGALSEGLEEVVSGGAQLGSDFFLAYLTGHESEVEEAYQAYLAENGGNKGAAVLSTLGQFAQSLAVDGLSGALSGLAVTGATTTADAIGTSSLGKQTASSEATRDASIEKVLNVGLAMSEGTQSYAEASKINEQWKNNKRVSNYQLGRLTQALSQELTAEQSAAVDVVMDQEIEKSLIEMGDTPESAKANAPVVRKTYRGQELTADESKPMAWTKNASKLTKELATPTKVSKSTGSAKEKGPVVKTVDYVTDDGNVTGEFVRFETGENGKLQMVTSRNGTETTVDPADISGMKDSGLAKVADHIENSTIRYTAEDATAMMNAYAQEGGDADSFIADYEAAYNAGYSGVGTPSTSLSDQVAAYAAEKGRAQAKQDETERLNRVKQNAQAVSQGKPGAVTWGGTASQRASVTGGSKASLKDAMENMTESQRATVEAVKQLAKVSGMNIVLFESTQEGLTTGGVENGRYDQSTHTIYLDVNAGATATNIQGLRESGVLGYGMYKTLAHEVTHYIEASSAKGYTDYKNVLKAQMRLSGVNWNTLVQQKAEELASSGQRLTRAGVEAEVVADASEMMLQNATEVFTSMARQNPTLAQKVHQFVNRFLDRIRAAFRHLSGNQYARAAMTEIDGMLQYAEELQKAWNAAFAEATGKTGAAVETATETKQETAKKAETKAAETPAEARNEAQEAEQEAEKESAKEKPETRQEASKAEEKASEPAQEQPAQPTMVSTYEDMVADFVAGRELGTTRSQAVEAPVQAQEAAQEAVQETIEETVQAEEEEAEEDNWFDLAMANEDWDALYGTYTFEEDSTADEGGAWNEETTPRQQRQQALQEAYEARDEAREGLIDLQERSEQAAHDAYDEVRERLLNIKVEKEQAARDKQAKVAEKAEDERKRLETMSENYGGTYQWLVEKQENVLQAEKIKLESAERKLQEALKDADRSLQAAFTAAMGTWSLLDVNPKVLAGTKWAQTQREMQAEQQRLQEAVKQAEETIKEVAGQSRAAVEAARQGDWTQFSERDSQYSFAGRSSENANRSTLREAQEMEFDDADMETIRQETGWFRGMDGEWRYEIDDSQATYTPAAVTDSMTLGNIYNNPELYEAYPELAETPVEVLDNLPDNANAGVKGKTIQLSAQLFEGADGKLAWNEKNKDTLQHEIQHLIQEEEGFAGGSSVDYWRDRLKTPRRNDRQIKQLTRQIDQLKNAQTEEVQTLLKEYEEAESNWVALGFDAEAAEEEAALRNLDRLTKELNAKAPGLLEEYRPMRAQLNAAVRSNREMTAQELYKKTAGEIEARDTAARRTLTPEQRKATRPELDEDAVFADDVTRPSTSQFELRNSVEVREDGLMAVHNVEADSLRKTLELGGFPMPSIAIVKAKDGHSDFGDYSVIFARETIDPGADKRNRVYGTDAYTAKFPRVEAVADPEARNRMKNELAALAGKLDARYREGWERDLFGKQFDEAFGDYELYENVDFVSGAEPQRQTIDDMLRNGWEVSGVLAAYLADKGETFVFDEEKYYMPSDQMQEQIDQDDFRAWLKLKIKAFVRQEQVVDENGESMPLTAENVVKAMLTQRESNAYIGHAGGLRQSMATRYGSVDEIKADAKRLKHVSREEYTRLLDDADKALDRLWVAFKEQNPDAWGQMELSRMIVQAAKGRTDAPRIRALFEENGYTLDMETARLAAQLIGKLQSIPTDYFEAKPGRVVSFDEVRMLVAPQDMPADLVAKLDELGIPYTTYDGTNADRLKKANAVEGVQFSTRYVDNQPVVWVENNILQEKPANVKTKTYIREYLINNINDVYTIIESGSKVYTAKKLPDEYLHSKYTDNAERFNRRAYRAKLKMVPGIGEMIEIATNRRWEPTKHAKNKDAKYGVYRYDTRIAFDNGGKVEAYTAELVILNASDGKKYLYDVVNIKKDDITASDLNEKARRRDSALQQTNAVDNSVPQSGEKVNGGSQYSQRAQTETEAFKKWFGDSEVVDEDGNPLVVYHTTYNEFTTFDQGRLGEATDDNATDSYTAATAHVGFWFSTKQLREAGIGNRVMPVYLSIQQMYDAGTLDGMIEEIWNEYDGYDPEDPTIEQAKEAGELYRSVLESRGYDGIKVKDTEFGGYSYIVFEPTQIKSATDNVGTFDAENPDIRYSTRTDEPDSASIREYLGNLEPTRSMTLTEKTLLGRYQEHLKTLQAKEAAIAEQEKILKTAKGEDVNATKNRLKVLREQANRESRWLTEAESSAGFARMMATSQEIVNKYMSDTSGPVADAADRLDEEVAELTKRLKKLEADVTRTAAGQRTAFARGLYDPKQLNAAAKNLKDAYGSRMSVSNIADRLALCFGELYQDGSAEGAKRFVENIRELADDILRGHKFRYKSDTLQMLSEKLGQMSLSEVDKEEIRNAGLTLAQYKKALSPYVKVTDGATDLSAAISGAQGYGDGVLASILGEDEQGNNAMRLYEVVTGEKARESEIGVDGRTEGEMISAVMADIAGETLPVSADGKTIDYLRTELEKAAGENADAAVLVEEAIAGAQKMTRQAGRVWLEAARSVDTAKQAVVYYRMLEQQRRLTELRDQKQAITEQLKTDAAKNLAEKLETQRSKYREREEKARAYRKAREELNKQRNRIGRMVKRLNRLRVRETDQNHVPQEFQMLADEVMQIFTDSSLANLAFGRAQTASLARTYRLLQDARTDAVYYWDEEIENRIEHLGELAQEYTALRNREGEVPSVFSLEGVEMESELLTGVEEVVEHVMHLIDSENKAFLEDRAETFAEFAAETGDALLKKKDYGELRGVPGVIQTILEEGVRTGNETPIYFFEHLNNPQLMDVYNEIRGGQTRYAKIVAEARDFVQETKQKYHYGRWVDDAPLTMKTAQGHEIELTREEAAAIYATARREKAMKLYKTEHLAEGGFQYKDASKKGKGKHKIKNMPNKLNDADLAKIGNWLTDEQKAYADALVGFLSNDMAEYGNEASMGMYGYKKFTESYYFPFQVSKDQRYQRGNEGPGGENAGTGRVKNSGFTHRVQWHAKETLVIGDITKMVTDHIHGMAFYSAMAQPIDNMNRLLNQKVSEEDGTTNTIRALIGQKYGKASQDYLTQLLKDLNGATESDTRAMKLVDKMVGAFKRGAVMASASVVLQQPTAAVRAMAYIPAKYFVQNPFYRPSKGTWDEMMKYSGTAIIKDMGKFDMGMSQTASEYIGGEELKFFKDFQRLKAEGKLGTRAMDWLTAAPGKADQWTWGIMWKANKAYQAKLHPEMNHNSEEFLNLCGKTFDDVMDHTQVYDSVLTRSNLMRSQSWIHKMATSFKAEPTLSLNMLYDAFKGKHSGKQRAGIIIGVMASQVLAGAIAALVQAWNDDDDKRNWLEKYADRATGNILDNINPLGWIPYVSDLMSIAQGYDVERADMSLVADVLNYGSSFFDKAFDSEKTLGWKDYENFIGTLCNMVGLPAKNISREMRRTWNAITNTQWNTPDAFNVGQVMLENLPGYDDKNAAYYERIVAADLKGDTELAEEYREYMLTSKMVTEDAMKTGVRKAYGEMYQEGGIEKEDAVEWLVSHGLEESQKDAFTTVDKWEEGSEKHSVYNTVREALAAKSVTQAKAAIKELTDNGWEQDDVATQTRKAVRELYVSGKLTQADVKTMYNSLSLHPSDFDKDDENDWYWLYKELDYAKANGGSSEGYSKYGDFEKACRTGTNLQAVVKEYMNHGVSKSTLSNRVTDYFKQEYIDLYNAGKRTELANLQVRILTAYQALGYDRDQKLKDIQKWVK